MKKAYPLFLATVSMLFACTSTSDPNEPEERACYEFTKRYIPSAEYPNGGITEVDTMCNVTEQAVIERRDNFIARSDSRIILKAKYKKITQTHQHKN